jgi:predicted acyl esterase
MNILIERNVIVPMRDGVKLAADVYRPAEGGPFPVIVQR